MGGNKKVAKGIFVVGTDTDVGKTFVTAGLTYVLRKNNHHACSYKPALSGAVFEDGQLIPGDVKFVKDIANLGEAFELMNAYCLKEAVSPHLAAEMEGVSLEREKIINAYKKLEQKYDFILTEGCGGVFVPLIRDKYYIHDLIRDLQIPAVIVARAGVGTINHTVLTLEFMQRKGIEAKGIIINGYTGAFYEDDNIEVIKSVTGLNIIAALRRVEAAGYEDFILKSRREYERSMEIEKVLSLF